MSYPLMQCGCRAQGTILTELGEMPTCVVHDCSIVGAEPNLEGRQAKCCYCKTQSASSLDLPFFTHDPKKVADEFYCGCRGWD